MSKRTLYLIILFLCTGWWGYVLFAQPLPQSVVERSPAEGLVLEARRFLRAEGTDFVFTLTQPSHVSVRVELSEHCTSEATVTVGPLRTALRPDPVYEPDAVPEHQFRVRAGVTLRPLELKEAGPYVLRIEPIPMAMGADGERTAARVVITKLGA